MNRDNEINYIEFPMRDKPATMAFYTQAFGWQFQEWGDTYISFTGAGVDGGFDLDADAARFGAGALIVLYHADLEAALAAVEAAGGEVAKPIFRFPGGRRFHFLDPNGNELAVWSERE